MAKNCEIFISRPKLPTLKPRKMGVKTTSKNTLGTFLSTLATFAQSGKNRFFGPTNEKFQKSPLTPIWARGSNMGVWYGPRCWAPPNLTLFGDIIIFSQFHTEKNLKKFLSPDPQIPGSKKSAVKKPPPLIFQDFEIQKYFSLTNR